jgi:hypothetical protein
MNVGSESAAGSPADKAVEAIIEMIVVTLHSDKAGRFADAERLCTLGQTLMRLRASSVAEVRELDRGGEMQQHVGVGGYNAVGLMGAPVQMAMNHPVQRVNNVVAAYGNGYNDQAELQRNLMMTLGPLAATYSEQQRAAAAASEAAELKTLMALREKTKTAHHATIDLRIEKLIDQMEARNGAKSGTLVDSVIPRGHSPGELEAGRNDAPRLRADGGRGGGDEGGAGAGPPIGTPVQAVV